ncbi:MAG: hypothetical protein ACRBN8_14840 [Nannocystales bacterium]
MKREIPTFNTKMFLISIAVAVGTFAIALGLAWNNGRLQGALDTSTDVISLSEVEAGQRPQGTNITLTGVRLGSSLEYELRRDGSSESWYYFVLHDATSQAPKQPSVMLMSRDHMFGHMAPDNGSYQGRLVFPDINEAGGWHSEIREIFAREGEPLPEHMIYFTEGRSSQGDLIYLVISLLVALIVSGSIAYGLMGRNIKALIAFRMDPYYGVPPVEESYEQLRDRLFQLLVNDPPRDLEETYSAYPTWRSLEWGLSCNVRKDGETTDAPSPEVQDVLTKIAHLFFRQDKDPDALHFSMEYDAEDGSWTMYERLD